MSSSLAMGAAQPPPERARLVDYFVEVTADIVPPPSSRPHGVDIDEFDRRIVCRIPAVDHADFPLPDGVPYFCIPSCLSAVAPSTYERKPTFFSFSLTGGDGSRAYGFALHCYISTDSPPVSGPTAEWRPRVFCLISHHPFFSLFKEIVSWVYRRRTHSSEQRQVESILADASDQRSWFVSPRGHKTTSSFRTAPMQQPPLTRAVSEGGAAPELQSYEDEERESHSDESDDSGVSEEGAVDRILSQLVAHGMCPCPGGVLELKLDSSAFFRYHVQRGNVTHLDDYCFQMLFQCLSLKNVLYIVNCMLLEQRVLIHSNHHGLLTPVCEALCALLFPFAWEHVYVPFLPVKLVEYLQAPVPYIMGLHTSSLATHIGAEIFSSCVVVHLDKDKVVTPISSRIDDSPIDFVLARLPSREVDALLRAVEHLVPQPVNSNTLHNNSIRTPRSNNNHSNSNTSLHPLASPTSPLPHVVESLSFSSTHHKSTADEVELTFGNGPLGITFESTHMRLLAVNHFQPGRHPNSSAVVKTLPRLQNGLSGPAERSGSIRAGSFLVAINGVSTLDLTFEETIDRLRVEKRPVRLRFLNAPAPHEGAGLFAERLQALSLVSAMQIDHCNSLLRWVDAVRSAFAVLFTSIFRDFQRFILIEHIGTTPLSPISSASPASAKKRQPPLARSLSAHAHVALRRRRSPALAFSVTFDHASFCETSEVAAPSSSSPGSAGAASSSSPASGNGSSGHSSLGFLREFTQTQSFSGFINDSVLGRVSHTMTYPQVELFHHCVHLFHELEDPMAVAEAIALLFERDLVAIETLVLTLPLPSLSSSQSGTHDSTTHPRAADLGSPMRSPVKSSPALSASSSPAKRVSKTRQLEMIICGSVPDAVSSELASLDMELLSLIDDSDSIAALTAASQNSEMPETIDIVTLHSPPRSPSFVASHDFSVDVRRAESLSSWESTVVVDGDQCDGQHEQQQPQQPCPSHETDTTKPSHSETKTKQPLSPEHAVEVAVLADPHVSSQSTVAPATRGS